MKIEREFPFYLIAKEFSLDIDEVKSWDMKKITSHTIFLQKFYERKYGKTGDFEDVGSGGSTSKMPKIPSKYRSKMPKMPNLGGRTSGHSFQFK